VLPETGWALKCQLKLIFWSVKVIGVAGDPAKPSQKRDGNIGRIRTRRVQPVLKKTVLGNRGRVEKTIRTAGWGINESFGGKPGRNQTEALTARDLRYGGAPHGEGVREKGATAKSRGEEILKGGGNTIFLDLFKLSRVIDIDF